MVARTLCLACVLVMSFAIYRSAPALTLDTPECRVRDEYGFGCYAKFLAGLEQQIRSILEEIATYNAVHRTSFELKQSQSAWEDSRQMRCGTAPSWNSREVEESFNRIECYVDITEKRFLELDTFVHELSP